MDTKQARRLFYPILHSLEHLVFQSSAERRKGRQFRRFYRATLKGRSALREANGMVRELFGELFEED